jgi:hypothetical protein
VLGYYTLSAEDAGYEQAPAGWALHGTSDGETRRLARGRLGDRARAVKPGRRRQGRGR